MEIQNTLDKIVRDVSGHEINEANRQLAIGADTPSHGNASHEYIITRQSDLGTEASLQPLDIIRFQRGPINENGINGVTNEALLAIVADRLRGFQSSEYSCRENACALTKIEEALHWLHHRTRNREARGVEGTHKV